MAIENLAGSYPVTFVASTGLRQYRGVIVNTSGKAAYPGSAGDPIVGVLVSKGTTGSTSDTTAQSVQIAGIAKMEATASTVAVGDLVSVDTAGRVTALGSGHYCIGRVVGGSSGAANRVLSVLLQPIGTT